MPGDFQIDRPMTMESTHETRSQIAVLSCGQVTLHSLEPEHLVELQSEGFHHVVTVNAEIFSYAHQDPKLRAVLSKSVNTIDGRLLQGICKLLYLGEKVTRVVGADFIYYLAAHCARRSERLFLLGASPEANSKAMQLLEQRCNGLQVSGFAPPFNSYPFPESLNEQILQRIEVFRPRHLVVCFGPVKQEFWINDNGARLERIGVVQAYGLGATIDFVAGTRKRAPRWVQLMGAEWLFRLLCEPRARARRTLEMFRMPYYALKTLRRKSLAGPSSH